jgi:hypothetical protein
MSITRRTFISLVFFLLGIPLVVVGLLHKEHQLDPLDRPRKVAVKVFSIHRKDAGKIKFMPPEEFGVTSREINRILIKLIREDPKSEGYEEKWNQVQNECLMELGILETGVNQGVMAFAVVDDANVKFSYIIICFGILIALAGGFLFIRERIQSQ